MKIDIDLEDSRPIAALRVPSIVHVIHNTLDKIEQKNRERSELEPPRHDRMSGAGGCVRDRWASLRGLPLDEGKGFSPRILALFRLGHIIEDEVISLLQQSGYEVTDQQMEVGSGDWVGHIDGIVWVTDGFRSRPSLLEVKSANARRFEQLEGSNYRDWSPGYYDQIQAYLAHMPEHLSEVQDAHVVVYNKNTSEMIVERILFDPERATELKENSLIVTTRGEVAPPRPKAATAKSCKMCRWCDRAEWCWSPATDEMFDE